MKNFWIIFFLLMLVIVVVALYSLRGTMGPHVARLDRSDSLPTTDTPPATVNDSSSVNETFDEERSATKIGKFSGQMRDSEFMRFRVTLPQPENKPWKSPFYDSQSCFDHDKRLAASEVLPIWIRKAVLVGETEMAARYLWSLMRLAECEDPEVATNAVFQIYRLGDVDGFAVSMMRAWIENSVAYKSYVAEYGATVYSDVRARVLDDLSFYGDRSLDNAIFSKWQANQGKEGKDLAAVDYAHYLVKHGRELPGEYWVQRLDNPYGFDHALEIAEQKSAPELTAKLQTIFEQLRVRPAATPDASRAATVASALFRQTGDARYRDYLAEHARVQLASGSFESSLPTVLAGLAATKDKAALEIVSSAMQQDNETVREMAIDALGKSRDPASAELLFEAATQKAEQRKRFPSRELHALLSQNDPTAESKYERLKEGLLSGQLGWSATASDFEALEFFRKHGRQ